MAERRFPRLTLSKFCPTAADTFRGISSMSNFDHLPPIFKKPFSNAVLQLRELINGCDGLVFLIGAGCSKCAGLPLTKELTASVLAHSGIDCVSKQILTDVRNVFVEATDAHIEDYLSEIVDLLAITERRAERGVQENSIAVGNAKYTAEQLRIASDAIKRAIASVLEGKVKITTHQEFVSSVHRPVRVGRPSPARVVDYLVLNYDTIIEDSLALGRIPYADGLSGGTTGWWDPATFDAKGLSARVIKLHGSINWLQLPDNPLPRRIGPRIELADQDDIPLLIWPSSKKYQEALLDPFAQLLDRARLSMRPSPGSQHLLVICGYSFGDAHINQEIDKALRLSERNLTVVAFTGNDGPTGLLKDWHEAGLVKDQVLIYAKGGFFHGNTNDTSGDELAWWKFEDFTKILKGSI